MPATPYDPLLDKMRAEQPVIIIENGVKYLAVLGTGKSQNTGVAKNIGESNALRNFSTALFAPDDKGHIGGEVKNVRLRAQKMTYENNESGQTIYTFTCVSAMSLDTIKEIYGKKLFEKFQLDRLDTYELKDGQLQHTPWTGEARVKPEFKAGLDFDTLPRPTTPVLHAPDHGSIPTHGVAAQVKAPVAGARRS